MKSATTILACLLPLTSTTAFAPAPKTNNINNKNNNNNSFGVQKHATIIKTATPTMKRMATMTAEELEGLSEDEMHNILGVSKDKLALGIDADEVLEFIGTRQDLITKFQTDIPKLSNSLTEAEAEVDKFLMDGEMLDLWIKYGQRKKEDPNWEPQYAEEDNGPFAVFSRIVGTYAIWIVGGLLVKDLVTGYLNKQNGGGAEGVGGEEVLVAVNNVVDVMHQITSSVSV